MTELVELMFPHSEIVKAVFIRAVEYFVYKFSTVCRFGESGGVGGGGENGW